MDHIDKDNLNVSDVAPRGDNVSLFGDDDVTIIVTQAYGPAGDSLMGIGDAEFDGHPAISLRVRAGDQDGLVHLSPFHGDRRKKTDLDLADGTACELLCPVSGQPLARAEASDDDETTDYYAIYLTPKLDEGDVVLVSNVWGHYNSRVVDNFELISSWMANES